MKNIELPTLPNGLPLWKLMQYKVTGEQCRIIKVNPEKINTDLGTITYPLTVDIRITREALGIKYNEIIKEILPYDLIVWNESMNPHREVTYRTRKGQTRTVRYN